MRVYVPKRVKGRNPKLQLFYKDIGTIVKKINDTCYLVSCKSWRENRVIHADKLRKVYVFEDLQNATEQRPNDEQQNVTEQRIVTEQQHKTECRTDTEQQNDVEPTDCDKPEVHRPHAVKSASR